MPSIVDARPFLITEPSLPEADPCVVVIFGASGDLTQRKLDPALYHRESDPGTQDSASRRGGIFGTALKAGAIKQVSIRRG